MLHELHPNELWAIVDPMPLAGLESNARLIVARLRDGSLWVHAPFAISDEDEVAIRALGEVRHIVVPNNFHYTQVSDFSRRFSTLTVWAPPQLDGRLKDVPHKHLETIPETWQLDFDAVRFDTPLYHEWVFCHRASRTLILTDLAINLPRPRTPLARIIARLTDVGRGFKPTRIERIMLRTGKRSELQAGLKTILNWDFERITMAHGTVIKKDGPRQLRRAYRWLLS